MGIAEGGGLVFSAIRGAGTRVAPASGPGDSRPVAVSDCTDVTRARLCESVESAHSSHDRSRAIAEVLGLQAGSVRLDSQAKYATVADGEAEIYLRLPVDVGYREKIWDHAAGSLVVSESGGSVTDTLGEPLDFSLGRTLSNNSGVVVSNGFLHEQVLEAVMASPAIRNSADGH
jgi:3'(2'), 5'-bisphosphate nucleotidase